MKLGFIFVIFLIPWFVSADVVVNEVAWMGAAESSYCEWVELYNDDSAAINLSGWGLYEVGSNGDILIMALTKTIAAAGYYLIERTTPSCPDPVPGIPADDIGSFGGSGLSNSGETLILKNTQNAEVDRVNGSGGWPAGDNTTKESMQKSGNGWITAAGTPRAANVSAMNDESRSTNYGESPQQESQKFFAVNAGEDIKTVAGAEVRFSGAAYTFDGEPLEETAGTIRYLWNFGDGTFFEGKNVNHIYRYPGAYRAALYVSSGQTSGSDVLEVAAEESGARINEIASNWIELFNAGSRVLDMSQWQIRNETDKIFSFPARTMIGPGALAVFSQEVTGLLFGPLNPKAELRYANGIRADTLFFAGMLEPEQSIARDKEGNAVIAEKTPGKENKMHQAADSMYQEPSSKLKEQGSPQQIKEEKNNDKDLVMHDTSYMLQAKTENSVFASNYFWLAVSVSAGLLAGAVVLLLRTMILF
jgi:hypothetical protein